MVDFSDNILTIERHKMKKPIIVLN